MIMFVPFLIVRHTKKKKKKNVLGVHICQPAVTLPTTPTSHELSVENVSPMIACRFFGMPQRWSYCRVLVNGKGAAWLGTDKEEGNQGKTK